MLLDKPDDAAQYKKQRESIRKSLHETFFDAEAGVYDKGEQTSYVLPLRLKIVAEKDRPRVIENFVKQIAKDDDHLTSGFVGMPFLLSELTEIGHGDVAWKIATQETWPSWFDLVFNRKKTVFMEDWKGGHVQMPSLCGSIGAWFYRSLGGIRPDEPGFKSFIVAPYTKTLDWVKCEHMSPYGKIVSNWSKENGKLRMTVSVPPNTTATVYVSGKNITESGVPVANAAGVLSLRTEMGKTAINVQSGNYTFKSEVK